MSLKGIPNELSERFMTPAGRKELMKKYGGLQSMFAGINEDGEHVHVSIATNNIVMSTFQSNGWIRVNFYDEEGFPCGESFDGRFSK